MTRQYETTLWNPTTDPNVWAADVYVVDRDRRERIHCGHAWSTRREAMAEAVEAIERAAA